jgi:shikimate dehydrogenase
MSTFFDCFENAAELANRPQTGIFVGVLGKKPSTNSGQNGAWDHLIKTFNLDAAYLPFDLGLPEDIPAKLKSVIAAAGEEARFKGFKIAPPFKEPLHSLLNDNADTHASNLQSANTVTKPGETVCCVNTDGLGMRHNLIEYFGPIDGKTVLIIGAGNSAASISDALAGVVGPIMFTSRSLEKSQARESWLKTNHGDAAIDSFPFEDIGTAIAKADIVINTTPVGRDGNFGGFSCLANTNISQEENCNLSIKILDSLDRKISFASTLYFPECEPLLQQAETRGHKVVNGLGMWLFQAAVAAKDHFFKEALTDVSHSNVASIMREGLRRKTHA